MATTAQTIPPGLPATLPYLTNQLQMAWNDQIEIWQETKAALRNLTIRDAWSNWWAKSSVCEDWTFRSDRRFKTESGAALLDLISAVNRIANAPQLDAASISLAISRLPSTARLALHQESNVAHSELESLNHKSGLPIRLLDFLICSLTFIGPNLVA